MADIVLTHGYFLSEDEKEQVIMRPYPPLGLMYLSAYLKSQNLEPTIFDSTFQIRDELYALFQSDAPSIVGIYTNLMTRASVLDIIRNAKVANWTVILGGPEASNYIDRYLAHGADFIVTGEGEKTLCTLVRSIREQTDHTAIKGLSYKNNQGAPRINPAAELARDIDQFPWPDRQAVNLQQYLDSWQQHHGENSVSMITARGCAYRCTWCSHAVFGYSHRRRNPVDCADELEHIVQTYNPDQIWYADDVFTINHQWLFEYAAELKGRGLKVPFETISRADRLQNDQVMDTLAEMGCHRIWIGAESGSQRLLDQMQRGVSVDQVYTATRKAQKRGIEVGIFLMWGYGDEQIEDIDETVRQVAQINPDIFLTTVAHPIKGTKYYEQNKEQIISITAWQNGSDRDYRLATRKSERYYRYATKYLKAHVEATRLEEKNPEMAKRKARHAMLFRRLLQAAVMERYDQ